MPKRIDFIEVGLRNNHLEIIDSNIIRRKKRNSNHTEGWVTCRCDCGKEFTLRYQCFKSGHVKQCHDCGILLKTKHKMCKTRIYNIWALMRQRCNNKNSPLYKNYGGRNIFVCEEWNNSFDNFYNWSMSNGYEDNLSIDRIDNDKGYSPENSRWATPRQQVCNTRGCKNGRATSKYKGVSYRPRDDEWSARIGYDGKYYYLGQFKDEKEAARAYNAKAKELHGEYAHLNIIDNEDSSGD